MVRARPLVILFAAGAFAGPAALAGEDAAALYAAGYDALQEERLDEAEKLLSACIADDPGSADCWWGLGWVSWKREAWSRAVRQWEQVERIDPAHAHLARWLPKAREKVAALLAPPTAAPTTEPSAEVAPSPVASVEASPVIETVASAAPIAPTSAPEPFPAPAPAPAPVASADIDGGAVLAPSTIAVQELTAASGPSAPIVTTAPSVVAPAPAPSPVATITPQIVTAAPTAVAQVTAPPAAAPGFDWSGTWHFGECWTTAAGFDACIDHAVRVFPKDGTLYAEYDADGYQTMTRYLCKVHASSDGIELVHVEDRNGNVFAGNPGEIVARLSLQGGAVEATLPGETDERLLARRDR